LDQSPIYSLSAPELESRKRVRRTFMKDADKPGIVERKAIAEEGGFRS
jgi:hypothetical protein